MTTNKIVHYIRNPRLIFSFLGRHGLLKWMPDELYLRIRYKLFLHKSLNLKNPSSFNEKIQWLKLNDHNPLYTKLVDKIEVKKYIAEKYPELRIIPTIDIWDRAEDIDFELLPEQFVLKCNHDSNSVVICKDRSTFDYDACRNKLNNALKRNFYDLAREWAYKKVKPKILAEPYMGKLEDYKFFCFNGKPEMLYVSTGLDNHATARISFYDFEGHEKPFRRTDYLNIGHDIDLPSNIDSMITIAKKIARDLNNPFSRVDLYPIDGDIYFSEITLYPANGLMAFDPQDADIMLGKMINLRIVK